MLRFAPVFTAPALAVALTGCSQWGGYCSDKMACLSGNDNDIDACKIAQDAEDDRASIEGCDQPWEDYSTCQKDHFACKGGKWTDDGACDKQADAYHECTK
jgi:hypothetical protein